MLIANLVIKYASIKPISIIIIVSINVAVKVIVKTNMKINFLIASQAINIASIKPMSTMNTVLTIVPVTPLLIPLLPPLKVLPPQLNPSLMRAPLHVTQRQLLLLMKKQLSLKLLATFAKTPWPLTSLNARVTLDAFSELKLTLKTVSDFVWASLTQIAKTDATLTIATRPTTTVDQTIKHALINTDDWQLNVSKKIAINIFDKIFYLYFMQQ